MHYIVTTRESPLVSFAVLTLPSRPVPVLGPPEMVVHVQCKTYRASPNWSLAAFDDNFLSDHFYASLSFSRTKKTTQTVKFEVMYSAGL